MHRFVWDLRYAGAPAVASAAAAAPPQPAPPAPGLTKLHACRRPQRSQARRTRPRRPPARSPPTPPSPAFPSARLPRPALTPSSSRQAASPRSSPSPSSKTLASPPTASPRPTSARSSSTTSASLHLVNDTNLLVSRITAAQATLKKTPDAAKSEALQPLADALITPRIRYSQPALQTHVTYLYSENNTTDQKLGHDAVERYAILRKQIDTLTTNLNRVLGPPTQADLQRFLNNPPKPPAGRRRRQQRHPVNPPPPP